MELSWYPKDPGFELTSIFSDADMPETETATAMSLQGKYVAVYLQFVLPIITEYQLADMFTKALPEDRFKYLVRRIGMRCLTPADLEVLTNETA
ncbi:hypothetical protein Tco_0770003 [Tanacetum coccineum]|uniref:Retrovirus-related Pol polyprotein from transposon TNT 1-94 n=1 Tax=Tanacetum coccineum TaxID=301880 RepID=A0ABQ4ZDX8_9ASTR